jgi:hypothetical protein
MTRDDIIRMARQAGIKLPDCSFPARGSFALPELLLLARMAYAAGAAAEKEAWQPVLQAVMREIPRSKGRDEGNAPGHAHEVPGIWDSDNGPLSGTECAWCKAWNTARATIRAEGQT